MNKRELDIVRGHVTSIFRTWHGCALKEREMRFEDYARGLAPGMLCDDCNAQIEARMIDIALETDYPNTLGT